MTNYPPCRYPRFTKKTLLKVGTIGDTQMFHRKPGLADSGFSWFPGSIFDLPVASSTAEWLLVEKRGVVGSWALLSPKWGQSLKAPLGSKALSRFVWGISHPLLEARLKSAIEFSEHHIILAERKVKRNTRGLLVKIRKMKDEAEDNEDIYCHLEGPVYFQAGDFFQAAEDFKVCIGDPPGVVDLDSNITVAHYVGQVWKQRQKNNRSLEDISLFSDPERDSLNQLLWGWTMPGG